MNRLKLAAISGVVAGSAAVGALGAIITGAGNLAANAATNSPAATAASPSPGSTFKSNETPSHEGTETTQREADENSGKAPMGGPGGPHMGGSNEDPTHEGTESPAREAQEGTGAPAAPSATPSPSSQ
jgi:hypothetical protein